MHRLVKGVHKFQREIFAPEAERFAQLADGQQPHTLFLACSDSRMNPNLLTQTEPGEVFVIRNAGNIVPPYGEGANGTAAAIEFAIAELNVDDIVICGHTHCGAMQALVEPSHLEHLPAMKAWLTYANETLKIIAENYPGLSNTDLINVAVQENVLVQIEHLRTHPTVAAGLESGRLRVHGWVYNLKTGEVLTYDPAESQFRHLAGPENVVPDGVPP